MNKENRAKVEQIQGIISTLSDISAIAEIENFMYNSRAHINWNAEQERKNVTDE